MRMHENENEACVAIKKFISYIFIVFIVKSSTLIRPRTIKIGLLI